MTLHDVLGSRNPRRNAHVRGFYGGHIEQGHVTETSATRQTHRSRSHRPQRQGPELPASRSPAYASHPRGVLLEMTRRYDTATVAQRRFANTFGAVRSNVVRAGLSMDDEMLIWTQIRLPWMVADVDVKRCVSGGRRQRSGGVVGPPMSPTGCSSVGGTRSHRELRLGVTGSARRLRRVSQRWPEAVTELDGGVDGQYLSKRTIYHEN